VAQLDKADAACAEADVARSDDGSVARPTSLPPPPPSPTSPTYHFLCGNCAKTCEWSGGEGQDASRAPGSDKAGDGGMGKVTRAAIARAFEVDWGAGGGESGAREGGEG
jgi:hypothetical protein